MKLYQVCSNYAPGVKNGPALGVTCFTHAYIGKVVRLHVKLKGNEEKNTKLANKLSFYTPTTPDRVKG